MDFDPDRHLTEEYSETARRRRIPFTHGSCQSILRCDDFEVQSGTAVLGRMSEMIWKGLLLTFGGS